jgi:hypothetical protein
LLLQSFGIPAIHGGQPGLLLQSFGIPAIHGGQPGLLLQSFGIPAIHGGQMCRHRSSTQMLDRWSKPTTRSVGMHPCIPPCGRTACDQIRSRRIGSAQRGEKAHGCAFSPAW